MKSFDEIFVDKTKYGVKIQTTEYGEVGEHIIIDQGQCRIAGYTDREEGLFEEVPVIIFGDHTRVIKYVDEPFFLGADGVKVLRSKDDNANYKYLYYALKNARIPDTGYNRHFKWLKEVQINYPDSDKQAEIVEILDKVSNVIKKREDELYSLDDLIKARFVEMFANWKKKYLAEPLGEYLQDITYGFTNPMPDAEEGPWKITAKDVANGIVNLDTARKTLQESYDKLTEKSKPQLGDVLLTKDGTLGRTAVVEIGGMCVNQSVAVLRINEKILPKYLSILLQMPKYQRDMIADAGGGTIKHIYITKVVKMPIVVPSIEEQNTFLDFVNQVDKSKVAVQKALDETKLLFDSLMQQYFG